MSLGNWIQNLIRIQQYRNCSKLILYIKVALKKKNGLKCWFIFSSDGKSCNASHIFKITNYFKFQRKMFFDFNNLCPWSLMSMKIVLFKCPDFCRSISHRYRSASAAPMSLYESCESSPWKPNANFGRCLSRSNTAFMWLSITYTAKSKRYAISRIEESLLQYHVTGYSTHTEFFGIFEEWRSGHVVSPHVVIGGLLFKSLEPIGEGAYVLHVFHKTGDVAVFFIILPDHWIDVDEIGLGTHTLPGFW